MSADSLNRILPPKYMTMSHYLEIRAGLADGTSICR
jgi:hypothetical protein